MITVTVPATSANVGAGFDSLGLALSMHNVFTFEECDRIRISSVDGTHVPTGANNLVYRSARAVYDQLGIPLRGLRITQRNDIPMARGLGSSSACIVAGILGANALLGNKLTSRQMLTLATAIEGHPDNVAPAMLGGFVTSVYDEGQVYSVKKNICDSYNPNFLIDKQGKMYLIDWEYAGMADPGCDIGTFIACSDYTPEEAEQVIARYLGHAPTGAELRHYIGYVAMASYFWFLWGLYQEACAKHVGEYLYIWYKYTKQYARLTLERYDHEEEFA